MRIWSSRPMMARFRSSIRGSTRSVCGWAYRRCTPPCKAPGQPSVRWCCPARAPATCAGGCARWLVRTTSPRRWRSRKRSTRAGSRMPRETGAAGTAADGHRRGCGGAVRADAGDRAAAAGWRRADTRCARWRRGAASGVATSGLPGVREKRPPAGGALPDRLSDCGHDRLRRIVRRAVDPLCGVVRRVELMPKDVDRAGAAVHRPRRAGERSLPHRCQRLRLVLRQGLDPSAGSRQRARRGPGTVRGDDLATRAQDQFDVRRTGPARAASAGPGAVRRPSVRRRAVPAVAAGDRAGMGAGTFAGDRRGGLDSLAGNASGLPAAARGRAVPGHVDRLRGRARHGRRDAAGVARGGRAGRVRDRVVAPTARPLCGRRRRSGRTDPRDRRVVRTARCRARGAPVALRHGGDRRPRDHVVRPRTRRGDRGQCGTGPGRRRAVGGARGRRRCGRSCAAASGDPAVRARMAELAARRPRSTTLDDHDLLYADPRGGRDRDAFPPRGAAATLAGRRASPCPGQRWSHGPDPVAGRGGAGRARRGCHAAGCGRSRGPRGARSGPGIRADLVRCGPGPARRIAGCWRCRAGSGCARGRRGWTS